MARFVKKVKPKMGLPPGSLVHVGASATGATRVTLMAYGPDRILEKTDPTDADIAAARRAFPVIWLNVDGVNDPAAVDRIGGLFQLHPLALEDVMSTSQRPKLEDYGEYLYLVFRMLRLPERRVESEQVSLFLGAGYVVTFQERPGDVFDGVRQRLRGGKGLARRSGSDYLAYALMDALVDQYFVILEGLGDWAEGMEERLVRDPSPDVLRELHRIKQEALYLRKAVWPLREVIGAFERGELARVSAEIRLYVRDLYDHTVQAIETVESLRDLIAGMQDVYLSSVSNRMNEVMKVLTIISTMFIPATFLASIYGMNFEHMPELKSPAGYFVVLGVMAAVMAGMLLFFRRRRWL